MSYVDGVVLDNPDVLGRLTTDDARRSCKVLVDTLLALHAVDPADVGLEQFGKPQDFLERQVKRWRTQWEASETGPAPASRRSSPGSPTAHPAGAAAGDGARRLPPLANVLYGPATSRASRPSSTGRWPRSATRSPTSASSSCQRSASGDVRRSPDDGEHPLLSPTSMVEQMARARPATLPHSRGTSLGDPSRRHRRGDPRPLPAGQDRRQQLSSVGVYVPRLLDASRHWLDQL